MGVYQQNFGIKKKKMPVLRLLKHYPTKNGYIYNRRLYSKNGKLYGAPLVSGNILLLREGKRESINNLGCVSTLSECIFKEIGGQNSSKLFGLYEGYETALLAYSLD